MKTTICLDCGRAPSTSGRKQVASLACPKTGVQHRWQSREFAPKEAYAPEQPT